MLEALETVQKCVEENMDVALQMWRGIEHVRNQAGQVQVEAGPTGELRSTKPIVFKLSGRYAGKPFKAETVWNERGAGNELFFEKESVRVGGMERQREGNQPVPQEQDELQQGRLCGEMC